MRTVNVTPPTTTTCTTCGSAATVSLVEVDDLYQTEISDTLCRWCALDAAQRMDAGRAVDDAIHCISDGGAATPSPVPAAEEEERGQMEDAPKPKDPKAPWGRDGRGIPLGPPRTKPPAGILVPVEEMSEEDKDLFRLPFF